MLALPDAAPLKFSSKGLNPFFNTEKEMANTLQNIPELTAHAEQVSEIYFFGSGCTNPDRREMVSNALTQLFPTAFIAVETDLIGSAYATCGNHKGFIAVLGTGSNISFFDGSQVKASKTGIGFILGDEGSGAWFGKYLVTQFLYGDMPVELSKAFRENFRVTKEIVIRNVYQRASPNTYLASFAPFLQEHRDHPYIHHLIVTGFEKFLTSNLIHYHEYREYIFHFVGSIAYFFQEELKGVCHRHRIQTGKIIQQPIEELYKYIVERELNYEI